MFLLIFSQTPVKAAGAGLYPDLVTVVPHHLQIVNQLQHTILRFSNSIANVGDGPLQLRPEVPLTDGGQPVRSIQDILDANGNVVFSQLVSVFTYESSKKTWEIADTSLYAVHAGSPNGPTVGPTPMKMACCLVNFYALTGNDPVPDRNPYWDCRIMQGLSVGYADQYHASTDGQSIDITGAPAGIYYLTSTANPSRLYLEKDYSNNMAWVAFNLTYSNSGDAQFTIVDHSPCSTPGLCGTNAPNR
jgi:hypothetical protein